MKYIIMIVATIYMAACSTNQGGGSEGGSGPSPASITFPMPTPQPSNDNSPPPSPDPTIPICASFTGTKWVADGQPTLTSASNDQLNQPPYVSTFDLTATAGPFLESQYVGAPLNYLICQRNYSAGIPASSGSTNSLVWTNTDGYCGSMISWFQFDTTTCNVLKVTLRDGSGNVYLTQNYKPSN